MKCIRAFSQNAANNAMPKRMKTTMQHLNVTKSFHFLNLQLAIGCVAPKTTFGDFCLLNLPLLSSWAKIPVYGRGWESSSYTLENTIAKYIQSENLRLCCNKEKQQSSTRGTQNIHWYLLFHQQPVCLTIHEITQVSKTFLCSRISGSGVLQKSNTCENINSYTECLGWTLEEYLISPQYLI